MTNNTTNMRITVGVIFGGRSVEHEVSVISGLQAIQNLDKDKYNTVPIYVSKEGIWYTGDALLEVANYKHLNTLIANSTEVFMTPNYNDNALYIKKHPATRITIDVILPTLHGGTGENGAVQGLFELKGIPFSGCGTLASSTGMDKVCTKHLLQSQNLPFVPYQYFYDFEWYADREAVIAKVEAALSYPLVVKPADLGSSVGITKATSKTELLEGVSTALQFTNKVLVEKAIQPLKEVNCSVTGDVEDPKPSILEEPLNTGEFLSYEDKYMSGGKAVKTDDTDMDSSGMSGSKRRIPADISQALTTQIRESAVAVFQLMCCSGVVRIDFLIDTSNDTFYINEVNTIPGSLSFYLWEPTGLPFPELLNALIQTAIKRWRDNQRYVSSYQDVNLFNMTSFSGKK